MATFFRYKLVRSGWTTSVYFRCDGYKSFAALVSALKVRTRTLRQATRTTLTRTTMMTLAAATSLSRHF